MNATLTSKGQLTLPKAARDSLRLTSGMRLAVEVLDGKLQLTPLRVDALAVRGILKSSHKRPLTIEEMDAGVEAEVIARHARRSRKPT